MTLRSRVDELKNEMDDAVASVSYEELVDELLDLLDRAMQGLEYYLPVDGYENEASRTLADIRKQLDGGGDGN